MTTKETDDIAVRLAVLLKTILHPETNGDDVANDAIDFTKDLLKDYPKVREVVGEVFDNFDSSDEDFQARWDMKIEWLKFEKTLKN